MRKPQFVCGYQGESDYTWNGVKYSVRHSADDWRPGVWNYSREQYEAERVAQVGCIYRSYGSGEFPPAELLEFFPGYVRARFNLETKSWEYAGAVPPEQVRTDGRTLAKVWADELAKYEAERAARIAALAG